MSRHGFEDYPRIQIIATTNNGYVVIDENDDLLAFADDASLAEWLRGIYTDPEEDQ